MICFFSNLTDDDQLEGAEGGDTQTTRLVYITYIRKEPHHINNLGIKA